MITMSLADACQSTGAVLHGEDVMFSGCSVDSRTLSADNLFIALPGDRFDGHAFIKDAKKNGASSLMLATRSDEAMPYLLVDDTKKAMGLLAKSWRQLLRTPVIAITGSNGKTTVKEMVASIISVVGRVHATNANQNNDIGVPLTLFGLGRQHQYAVIEMGANHPGEIAWLSAMSCPDVAVITQCAPAHLEGFGSIEGVATAKAEIYSGLSTDGIAIINLDDDYASDWQHACRARRQMTFSAKEKQADVFAQHILPDPDRATVQFDLCYRSRSVTIQLPLAGRHNVMNALAASACCLALDLSLQTVQAGLQHIHPVQGRLQVKRGMKGARIIDDSYNANPSSLLAAIRVLRGYRGKRYLVLGDMGELGDTTETLHYIAGQTAKSEGIDKLYSVGNLTIHAVRGYGEGAAHFESDEALSDALCMVLDKDVTILIKGSRSMHMEHIVNVLTEDKQ